MTVKEKVKTLPDQVPNPAYYVQKCPVCDGRGVVEAGFYGGDGNEVYVEPEACRTCKGFGVIVLKVAIEVDSL